MVNVGMDFTLFKGRVSGSFEYYTKNGIDLVGLLKIDPTTGFTTYTGNGGTMKAKGIDLNLNAVNIKSKSFTWETTLIVNYNTDKVTKTDEAAGSAIGPYFAGNFVIGKPVGSLFSYRWAGLDPSSGNPRGYVADTVADYTVVTTGSNTKPGDLVYNGPTTPPVFGSVLNTISWRDISLSFNITYRFNYYFRRRSINYSNLYLNFSSHSDYSMRWQKAGDENFTNVPSLPPFPDEARDRFYSFSEILVEKGDHIRLNDIRLSYNLNQKLAKKSFLKNAELYIYANNIGILWRANRAGLDPDYGDSFIPVPRSVAVGLTANF
jgi:hypothetical protein